ncbi:hypothetical protein QTP70_011250 [Hemibagrus guttatus]|uniref:ribonuclease H n=1 Tax=Hemibagrus guttatus TaxID=175788 RepID=A0AAE0R7M6_9TELE|nr:hypothetical protein QTP70_011250 [Hemibagrus guttatus]
MEKYRDGQKELHCVFVDLEKAYDRVPREELWYCMRKSGVAEKYVRVVQDMYERSRTVVRCAVGQTEEFNVEVGLHQGSALSPFLFAMVMDQLSEEVRQESPWTMMFADDIVICSESREQVEENLERWRFALERRGMKVSRSKTEYMCVNGREGSGTVRLQGEEVKKVQEFKYLGSTVQSNGECGKEKLHCQWSSAYLLVTIILGVKCYKARGLCAVSADTNTEKVLKVGSSLDLTVTYPKNSVSFVQWNFNGKTFADYTPSRNYTLRGSQFSGRLKGVLDLIGVTLQDLQPQDSGTFSIVALGVTQYPTQIIKVYIQSPIRVVQIERTQRWLLSTNSCEVDMKCAAHGAENVSYLWSGYKIANGAQLQFNLSPAEGAITLNCTAANNISSSSATETLSCSTEPPETEIPLPVLKLTSSLVAASPYLLVTIILVIKCYRVQDPIRAVQIERTQRWLLSTNSCEVDVKCAAHGAENVSYLWSGYKIANGAQLQFNLSPAEGAITLNCTAANNISSSFITETLSCSTEQPKTDETVLKLTSSLVAASPYLLVTIILTVKCYRVQGHHSRQYAVTVIEE